MSSIGVTKTTETEHSVACTISEILDFLKEEIHDPKVLQSRYDEAVRRFGRSEILDDLITWEIDAARIYLFENHASTYSLLGSTRFGTLPNEKSSICEAIKRAQAIVELTGFTYRPLMLTFLEKAGPSSGMGVLDNDGKPKGFALSDFAGHRTKLIPLHKLVQSGKAPLEPDWEKFFGSGFLEYKAYCFSMITDRPKGSFADRSSTSKGPYRPGRVAEERDENSFEPPDPFRGNTRASPPEEGIGSRPPVEHHVILPLPEFSKGKLPSGTCPRPSWLFPAHRGILAGTEGDATSVDDKQRGKVD